MGGELGVGGVVGDALVDATGALGHHAGEQDDEADHALPPRRGVATGPLLDLVEDHREMTGGGHVGLDPPRGEVPPELIDDPEVGTTTRLGEERRVGLDEAGDEVAGRGVGSQLGATLTPRGVDRTASAREDLQQEALPRAEVVRDRRDVALLSGLDDLPGGDALDPAAGEKALRLVEETVPRGALRRWRLSPPAGAGSWWG